MSYDVLVIQHDELNPGNVLQDLHGLRQPRRGLGRQVDLRNVASDDELGGTTHTGESKITKA